jgi:hypothetical protein
VCEVGRDLAMTGVAVRFDDIRNVGFSILDRLDVVVFANSGMIITDSLMIILGAGILMAGC